MNRAERAKTRQRLMAELVAAIGRLDLEAAKRLNDALHRIK